MSFDPVSFDDGLRRAKLRDCEVRYLRVGRGTRVVLLHPLRAQLDYFRPLLAHLDPAQLEVIAPDLPGHGESSAPTARYTAEYFTDATEQLLEVCELRDAIVVGESIGGSIALGLAARRNPRLAGVVALNPYDYGRRGGIRRSSPLADVLFTAMLWPGIGQIVARSDTKAVLRRVLEGGLHDRSALPRDLLDEMYRCGTRRGHPRAFRSLCLNWRSWITAREGYGAIEIPVTLVYGEDDWSRVAERDANADAIAGARRTTITNAGHFSCLEKPRDIAQLIGESSAPF